MFGNYQELPPDFIIRRIRNSDIFDVIEFGDDETLLKSRESETITPFILIIIALFVLLIVLSLIAGSFIAGLFYTVITTIVTILMMYAANYFYWINNVNSGKCFAIYHRNKIRTVIATFNFDSGSYIKYLLVSNTYRRRGLGRYLINRIKQNSNYPIYIICCPESYLFELCSSLGFVAIEENELPRRISKSFGMQTLSPLIPMMLEENLEA